MCALLIQNRLIKQTYNYNHTPNFYSLAGATTLELGDFLFFALIANVQFCYIFIYPSLSNGF